jgi:hypothetical protein
MDIVGDHVLTSAESPLLNPPINDRVPDALSIKIGEEEPKESAYPGIPGEPQS